MEISVRDLKLERMESAKKRFDSLPMASYRKELFFAIHLFEEQVFSLNNPLALKLATYLTVNRKECCENKKYYERKYGDDVLMFEILEPLWSTRL